MNKYFSNVHLGVQPLNFDIRTYDNPDNKYHYKLNIDTVNPEIKTLLENLGIGIALIEVFFTLPNITRGIHIDTAQGGDITKLNWVYCKGANFMQWYCPKEGVQQLIKQTSVSTNFVSYQPDEVDLLHSEKLITNSIILQVGIPHNVKNLHFPRWAVSFTICNLQDRSRITMEDAQRLFSNYIR